MLGSGGGPKWPAWATWEGFRRGRLGGFRRGGAREGVPQRAPERGSVAGAREGFRSGREEVPPLGVRLSVPGPKTGRA